MANEPHVHFYLPIGILDPPIRNVNSPPPHQYNIPMTLKHGFPPYPSYTKCCEGLVTADISDVQWREAEIYYRLRCVISEFCIKIN